MEHNFISSFILLALVLDPLGNLPIVTALLKNVPRERWTRIILRECFIAALILLFFLVSGSALLKAMRLSEEAISIAGGIILFMIAIHLAFPTSSGIIRPPEEGEEPFVVPLAIPLISGPSAIATVILLASNQPQQAGTWALAIVSAMAVTTVLFLSSRYVMKILGKAGMTALERLSGLILTAIAVQMLITGFKSAFNVW